MQSQLHIIGGGLAGSEAAWQAAEAGVRVTIHEMRTKTRRTEAHQTDKLAELVCSNSFRSDDAETSAIGCLHEEMRRAGSLILAKADAHRIPAGGALAMDREAFSAAVQSALESHPNITVTREEITGLPPAEWGNCIIATGPLTSAALAESIRAATGEEHLAFFDAIAPIVHTESINFEIAWFQSRYDKGTGKDYINCPMTRAHYADFIAALLAAEKTEFREWEKNTPYFEGCLPIEVMAERGPETLRFGPMKPVGLTNPRGEKPYAVVQLRQDNVLGTLYNMVGFQTKLKYGEQQGVFRAIPGLENAEFARLGGIHRNTFINSPRVLDGALRLKAKPHIRFAGQVTGVEGYVESAACGLLAGRFAAAELLGKTLAPPPSTTAMGALLAHITGGHYESVTPQSETIAGLDTGTITPQQVRGDNQSFQPMNINFGLFPPLEDKIGKKDRKRAYCARALRDLDAWLSVQ